MESPFAVAPATPPLAHPPVRRPNRRRPFWRRAGSAIVAALVALVNLAGKLKALLFLLPKLKVLATSATMLVSVAAYSTIWGWRIAAGFVVLLFLHEMGHVIQLRREGIKASAPVFIPFMGAVIGARSLGDDALAEARVGLAGPVLGSAAAAACFAIYAITGHTFWVALAFLGFLINLFNLVPVPPLDGGRAMAAMSPWMWVVGFGGIAALTFFFPNPIMWLVLLFGGMQTYRRLRERRNGDPATQAYYRVAPRHRLMVAAVYVGLAAALVVGLDATHLVRTLGG